MKNFSKSVTKFSFALVTSLMLVSCGSDSSGNNANNGSNTGVPNVPNTPAISMDYVKECPVPVKSLFTKKDDYKTSTSSVMRVETIKTVGIEESFLCAKTIVGEKSVTSLLYSDDIRHHKLVVDKSMQNIIDTLLMHPGPEVLVHFVFLDNSNKTEFDQNYKNVLIDYYAYKTDPNDKGFHLYVVQEKNEKKVYSFIDSQYSKLTYKEPMFEGLTTSIQDGVITVKTNNYPAPKKFYLIKKL